MISYLYITTVFCSLTLVGLLVFGAIPFIPTNTCAYGSVVGVYGYTMGGTCFHSLASR